MLHEVQYFYILISFALSLLIHYLVIQLTHSKGIFLDEHEKVQKVHEMPTPRIGGLGIFLSAMFIINDNALGGYLMLAAIPAFIAGFLEDYSGKIAPIQRLAIMCLSPIMAFIMIHDSVLTEWHILQAPIVLGILASTIFIIALVNGVNFTDGQNGLASGTVLISLLTISFIAWELKDHSLLYIGLILASAVSAFLFYNFPKGKIFLGDGGAYFLGFMVATISIILVQSHTLSISLLLLPVILIYPLWEVLFSTLRKLLYDRISPLNSDDYHLHQLIFRKRKGGKTFTPVLYILPAQVIVSVLAIRFKNEPTVLAIIILVYICAYSVVYFYERKRDEKKNISPLHIH